MPDRQKRPKSVVPSVVIGVVVLIVVLGVAYFLRIKAQKPADFSDDGSNASSIELGTTSKAVQVSAEQTLQTFLGDLRRQDYNHALAATAKDFPSPHTTNALKTIAQSEAFPHILNGPLKFEPAHLGSHGQSMILRGVLQSNDKPYRIVCTFVKKDNVWLISNLQAPSKSLLTPSAQSSGAAHS